MAEISEQIRAGLSEALRLGDADEAEAIAVQALKEGMDPAMARLTLARRIAAAVLAMWKEQEDYDPKKHANET